MAEYRNLKITGANGDENEEFGGDYAGLDISSLPDQPNLTAAEMKARFDALVKRLIVPRFNTLLEVLSTAPEQKPVYISSYRSLVAASAEYTDFSVPWAKAGMAIAVTSNDSLPKVLPKSAICDVDGTVRVFWISAPSSSVGSLITIVGGEM